MIQQFAELIPASMLSKSGSVFYSGRAAFTAPSKLYVLGENPGGSPKNQASETIKWHTNRVVEKYPAEWSAYADESWKGKPPGCHGLQPHVLHMFRQLEVDPRHVPSSNVVFIRTRQSMSAKKFKSLAMDAWGFHKRVIDELHVRVVLCFGGKAGNWMKNQLHAHDYVDDYVETNHRNWRSVAHRNDKGIFVLTLSHPSRAAWRNPDADPTSLVRRVVQLIQ